MTDYPRIPIPGFTETDEVKPVQIVKSNQGGLPVRAGTIAGGQGIIPAGCVLGVRADKKFYVYNDAAGTGEETAVAIFIGPFAVDTGTGATAKDQIVHLAMPGFGELFLNKLSGADANAITDLGARTNATFNSFVF
jgi:hypothetical protein